MTPLFFLVACLLSIAALYDVRSYTIPLWIWIPAGVLCLPVLMQLTPLLVWTISIPLIVIWYMRYKNLHGGADTLAFSTIAITTPVLILGVPLVFYVMLLACIIAYFFVVEKKYPLVLSISLSYWLLISIP